MALASNVVTELVRAGMSACCVFCNDWFRPLPRRRMFCPSCPPDRIDPEPPLENSWPTPQPDPPAPDQLELADNWPTPPGQPPCYLCGGRVGHDMVCECGAFNG